jgi:hypothetical protein
MAPAPALQHFFITLAEDYPHSKTSAILYMSGLKLFCQHDETAFL